MYVVQAEKNKLSQNIDDLILAIKGKLDQKSISYVGVDTLLGLIDLIPFKINRPRELDLALRNHTIWKEGDNLYIVGGVNSGGSVINTHKMYNYTTNSFTDKLNYPINVAYHTVASWYGKIFYFGGSGSGSNVNNLKNNAYQYNKNNNTFTVKNNLSHPRSTHTTTVTADKIILSGGYYNNSPIKSQLSYTVASDSYTEVASLKVNTDYFTSAWVKGDKVLHTGGNQNDSKKRNYIYDDSSRSFTDKANFEQGIRKHTCTRIADNEYIYIGGYTGNDTQSNKIYHYNVSTDVWTGKKNMPHTLNMHTTVKLKEDLLLISGGKIGDNTTNQQSIYEISRDRFIV